MVRDRTYASALPPSSATHPGPSGMSSPVSTSRTGPGTYTLTFSDRVHDVLEALEVDLDVVVDVDVEVVLQRVDDQLRATGRIGRVDAALARQPGHVHHQVAGERHHERALRTRFDVRDHQRVGVASRRPSSWSRTPSPRRGCSTNCRVSLPMMRKFAPCGGASAVISWMRLILLTRVSISWLTLATAAVVTDVASTSAIRKRPRTRVRSSGRPQTCVAA